MVIDGQGEIVSCTGFAAPVTGKLLSESGYVAGYVKTGDSAPGWEEIMLMEASLSCDTAGAAVMSGSFVMDCGTCDHPRGTFSLRRDTCVTVVQIRSFEAGRMESGVELTWEVTPDEAIKGFKIERRLVEGRRRDIVDAVNLVASGERRYIDGGILNGQSYLYTLVVIGAGNSVLASESVSIKSKAQDVVLYQNHPNPFNPTTTISFEIPEKTHTQLSIYNIAGNCIRTLVNDVMNAGGKAVVWDGRDESGNAVSSGIYFYRLTVGNRSLTKKMVLLK